MAGLTALSVETSTNRSTPASPAAAATMRVATRCCAPPRPGSPPSAAQLVGGRVEDHRRPVLEEQLAHPRGVLAVGEHRGHPGEVALLLGWRRTSKRLFSAFSTSTSSLGPTRASWRRSSAPIELLASVIKLPAAHGVCGHAVDLHPHRLAAEHVLPRTSRTCRIRLTPPERSSKVVRSVWTRMPRVAACGHGLHRGRCPGIGDGDGDSSSGLASSSTRGRSSVVPSTLSPAIRMPCLRGSSSNSPTGAQRWLGVAAKLEATCWPPLPRPRSVPRGWRGPLDQRRPGGPLSERRGRGSASPKIQAQRYQEVERDDASRQVGVGWATSTNIGRRSPPLDTTYALAIASKSFWSTNRPASE